MEKNIIYARPNPTSATRPVVFNPEICTGCNKCVNVCQTDVFIPNPIKRKPPIILHPDECWYCSPCIDVCPKDGAITLNYPLMWRIPWKRKDTGKHYWYGMKNPPPPNTRPMP